MLSNQHQSDVIHCHINITVLLYRVMSVRAVLYTVMNVLVVLYMYVVTSTSWWCCLESSEDHIGGVHCHVNVQWWCILLHQLHFSVVHPDLKF